MRIAALLRSGCVAASLALAASAAAVQPDEVLADRALEARARHLSGELRCLVCQNQSIDDSDAPLARDLRLIVRERLSAGATDGEVRDFLVARYGEFVLLKPPVGAHTALLWFGPPAVLAMALLWLAVQRRRRPEVEPPLSGDERSALKRVLDGDA